MVDLTYLAPAMELSSAELQEILHGRKELFDRFYFKLTHNLPRNERKLFKAVAQYRDRYVDVLGTPYMTKYCIFTEKDEAIIWEVSGLEESEVDAEIKTLKKFVNDTAKMKGYSSPASLFKNLTAFRVILILMMRYYMEKGQNDKLEVCCAYMGYSMFYSTFTKFFKYGLRKETMVYTVGTLTNKHKLKQTGSVDGLLTYGVHKCLDTYKQKVMNATDSELIYVIQQFKSRLSGYFKDIADKYYKNDKNKDAVFASSDRIEGEDGTNFVERDSSAGKVEALAQTYTTRFFQKPIDDEIITMVCRINETSRNELKNALTGVRNDNSQIPVVKNFYEACFFIYQDEVNGAIMDVHSRKFLTSMDIVYRKGNSKELNITDVKATLDKWLKQFSQVYKEANRSAKLNSYRKAIFQYFIFIVVLRK